MRQIGVFPTESARILRIYKYRWSKKEKMDTVAIIHGNIDKIVSFVRDFVDKDPTKKPCWSRLQVTSDGAIAWFRNSVSVS